MKPPIACIPATADQVDSKKDIESELKAVRVFARVCGLGQVTERFLTWALSGFGGKKKDNPTQFRRFLKMEFREPCLRQGVSC